MLRKIDAYMLERLHGAIPFAVNLPYPFRRNCQSSFLFCEKNAEPIGLPNVIRFEDECFRCDGMTQGLGDEEKCRTKEKSHREKSRTTQETAMEKE